MQSLLAVKVENLAISEKPHTALAACTLPIEVEAEKRCLIEALAWPRR